MFLICYFPPTWVINSINQHLDLLSHETMIVNMVWHVLQKAVKCFFIPPPRLSYIDWHPAVYKRRYSFKVTKYWPINWRIFVEIRLRKKKWLLCSCYNPKKNLIANHLNSIGRNLDSQLGQYENFILMGDFNVEPNDANMKKFLSDLRLQKYCQR